MQEKPEKQHKDKQRSTSHNTEILRQQHEPTDRIYYKN